jgi:hypothetical protein
MKNTIKNTEYVLNSKDVIVAYLHIEDIIRHLSVQTDEYLKNPHWTVSSPLEIRTGYLPNTIPKESPLATLTFSVEIIIVGSGTNCTQ